MGGIFTDVQYQYGNTVGHNKPDERRQENISNNGKDMWIRLTAVSAPAPGTKRIGHTRAGKAAYQRMR
jgi:hypothetical protein